MSGRHRAARRLTLGEHFLWALMVAVIVMVAVLTVSYEAQRHNPRTIRTVCEAAWDCEQHRPVDQRDDTRAGATP